MKRKTPADYAALAEKRGFQWLGPEVPNTRTKTDWACAQGHHWEAPYSRIQQGYGCPVCAGRTEKTPRDYNALAEARSLQWLGPEVPNTHTKTSWECNQGHRWEAKYNHIQQGHGCPVCAGVVRKTSADYHAIAEERGFRWLGPEVSNSFTGTGWECEQGHQWKAPYSRIQQGHGCPVCAGPRSKAPADYFAMAEERGFRWLGPEVSNVHTKTGWECEQGHQWKSKYNNIQQGHGCPICAIQRQAGQRRLKAVAYCALAKERGFQWLSPEVPNVHTKTDWECEQGHLWKANYNNIQQGSGCPVCAVERGARQ